MWTWKWQLNMLFSVIQAIVWLWSYILGGHMRTSISKKKGFFLIFFFLYSFHLIYRSFAYIPFTLTFWKSWKYPIIKRMVNKSYSFKWWFFKKFSFHWCWPSSCLVLTISSDILCLYITFSVPSHPCFVFRGRRNKSSKL